MIAPIGGNAPVNLDAIGPVATERAEPGFAGKLEQAVAAVDGTVTHGDDALTALASGSDADLHGVMIAMQEADIALRAMVTVRDRVVNAYEQLMNLSI